MITPFRAALVLMLLPVAACQRESARRPATFEIHDAWVRAIPDSGATTAAYMRLVNGTSHRIFVSRFVSDAASAVELHETTIARNGDSRMAMLDSVAIPAGDTLSMQPGGYHLMVIATARPLIAGTNIRIAMHLSDGSIVSTSARVKCRR